MRHDYISEQDAPFLHSMLDTAAYGSLIPTFGFEPDGAYFSGLNPEECNGGAQYWRNPNERVFYLVSFFRLLNCIPLIWWRKNIRRALRLVAQIVSSEPMTRKMAPTNEIPLSILSQFSFSFKKLPCDRGFTPTSSIFDVLRNNGRNFFFMGTRHTRYI